MYISNISIRKRGKGKKTEQDKEYNPRPKKDNWVFGEVSDEATIARIQTALTKELTKPKP